MENVKTIRKEIAALIPKIQLNITRKSLQQYSDVISHLEALLEKCPNIGETDKLDEHPAIFHYFHGSTDIYICEYDRKDYMFGFAILNGDLYNSEWGYFCLTDLTRIGESI